MQLVGYNFEEDVICAIEDYERDKNPSLNGLVEEFIKGILYDSGYYRKEIPEDEIFTPKELNKIDNFSKTHWGNEGKVRIKYDDLSFGSFKEEIADEIIFRLARLSDEELIKYSKTYCHDTLGYTHKEYSDFIFDWLKSGSMMQEKLYDERITKFSKINKGRYFQLKYLQLNFGVFKNSEIDEVISQLLDFSDEELEEMSLNNWKYSKGKYKRFIRQKLENPLLTAEEFMKHNKVNQHARKDNVTYDFNGELIASFNRKKYSQETIDDAKLFLNSKSDIELMCLADDRKKSDLTSAEFILELMTQSKKLPYVYNPKQGNPYIYRNGANFGTYPQENITEVWYFLESKNWDDKYSSKNTGLKGKKHSEWLCSEMKKEQFILMEGK